MIIWFNTITNERSLTRPDRVRLDDNTTRTGPEVTDDLLVETGWITVEEIYEEPIIPISSSTNIIV